MPSVESVLTCNPISSGRPPRPQHSRSRIHSNNVCIKGRQVVLTESTLKWSCAISRLSNILIVTFNSNFISNWHIVAHIAGLYIALREMCDTDRWTDRQTIDTYIIEYKVGGGGGLVLHISSFQWKCLSWQSECFLDS